MSQKVVLHDLDNMLLAAFRSLHEERGLYFAIAGKLACLDYLALDCVL